MNMMSKLSNFSASVVLATGIAASAFAASPPFTVDPDRNAATNNNFVATQITGFSSELLTLTPGPNTASGSGWLQFTGFQNGANAVLPGISRLGVDYQLYLTFNLTATLSSGPFGQAGSNYTLNSLNFQLRLDPNLNTTFVAANAPTATGATVGGTTGDDILLGSGSLISGVAGFDAQFGAFLNSIQTYANTAAGNAFFVDPVPFYSIATDAFNNTVQGVQVSGNLISITNAAGVVDFNRVPEPETVGLLGIGLLGMVMGLRRRKAKVVA